MLINEVELENIKSYAHTVVSFAEGVNAICGPNGAGKTTILEAIGYALFGYLPYKQEDFLKEGEKSGAIIVSLVSSLDERLYRVTRRIGRNPAYYVYDTDANYRSAEGSEDVQKWLREHLALDDGADLRTLFLDTVGVPQGTLTAIFLESAGVRRPKFDRLLRIEEYEQAFKRLLETKTYIVQQLGNLENEVAGLEGRTAIAPELESQLQAIAARKATLASHIAVLLGEDERARARRGEMEQARDRLQQARSAYEVHVKGVEALWRQLTTAVDQLTRAEQARAVLEASEGGYIAYERASSRLEALEKDRAERDRLRTQLSALDTQMASLEADQTSTRKRLDDCREAESRLPGLGSAAAKQDLLEAELLRAQTDAQSLAELQREATQRHSRVLSLRIEIEQQNREIAGLELLRPACASLNALVEEANALLGQIGALQKQQSQLAKTEGERQAAERKHRQAHEELGRVMSLIARIETLREKAEGVAEREMALREAESRIAELRAALAQTTQDRQHVQGGTCPFLGEACRNLREGVTLEAVLAERTLKVSFLLKERDEGLAGLCGALEEARGARQQLDRLADLQQQRAQLEQAVAESESVMRQAQEAAVEMTALPGVLAAKEARRREVSELIRRAQEADRQVSAVPAKMAHAASLSQSLRDEESRLAALRERSAALENVPERIATIRRQLADLGDVRTAHRVAAEQSGEKAELESALASLMAAATQHAVARGDVELRLAQFATLDGERADQKAVLESNRGHYQSYLRNVDLAQTADTCRQAKDDLDRAIEDAERALDDLRVNLASAEMAFDEAALEECRRQVAQISTQIGEARADIRNCEALEAEKAAELEGVRALQRELRTARERAQETSELKDTLDLLRTTIKDAGPYVTEILLHSISAQATSINAEIMGTHAAELEWTSDYDILLRQRGLEKSFRQLSGGEQMSAALSVRLALLRELSGIDVAFFDEPTQNMDQERRANLAEQIPNLKGFSQLFVITHDDSFETSIDHVIRVEKRDGRSVVTNE